MKRAGTRNMFFFFTWPKGVAPRATCSYVFSKEGRRRDCVYQSTITLTFNYVKYKGVYEYNPKSVG